MNTFLLFTAVWLLLTLVAGMIRVMRGPAAEDRMMAAQLFGTTGVAMILLLAKAWQAPFLTDIALVFALLAAVVGVTFVRRVSKAAFRSAEEAS